MRIGFESDGSRHGDGSFDWDNSSGIGQRMRRACLSAGEETIDDPLKLQKLSRAGHFCYSAACF